MRHPCLHGAGYVPVPPELRERVRRKVVATGSVYRAGIETRTGEEILHRILDLGTARRSVIERLTALLLPAEVGT